MKNQVLIKVVKTKVRLDLFCFLNWTERLFTEIEF